MIFGTTPTVTNDTVNKYIFLMPEVLKNNPHASIRFPTQPELAAFAGMVTERYRNVRDVAGFIR
jgi:hypothetical protein